MKELNPKVNQVLDQQGYDPVTVDSLEFKQLREELIQLKLDQFEQKRVLLSGETDNVENSVGLEKVNQFQSQLNKNPQKMVLFYYLTYATDLLKVEKKEV